MSVGFCNNCSSTGELRYRLSLWFCVLGIVLLAFAGVCFLGFISSIGDRDGLNISVLMMATVVTLISAACFAMAWFQRALFCSNCGSSNLIPADSPKAIEFGNRAQTFDFTSKRIPVQRRESVEVGEHLP